MSIGVLSPALMQLLEFNGWDTDNPPTLRQCASAADCCVACSCLLTPTGGVCATLRSGTCLVHAHCPSPEHMCAGDGKCVQPVMEITNDASNDAISFSTYSSNCSQSTSVSLDTWGTSKEETIQDILQSSGMCSYWSWYEHRQLVTSRCASANNNKCSISRSDLWNFTVSDRNPSAALTAGVLKTLPHKCDVDYEHMDWLTLCSPRDQYLLYDQTNKRVVATLQRVNRTHTYQLDTPSSPNQPTLSIVKQPYTSSNLDTRFFITDTVSYTVLGYNTYTSLRTGSRPQLCSNLVLCSTQSSWNLWRVNGVMESSRLITDNNVQRQYNTDNMIACNASGYLSSLDMSKCIIDPGTVLLFYVFCWILNQTHIFCTTTYKYNKYTLYQSISVLAQIASDMNSLLTTTRANVPTDWPTYIYLVEQAALIYCTMQTYRQETLLYSSLKKPKGLYFLMQYAAYEIPFAWLFCCSWLMGIIPSASPTPCATWSSNVITSKDETPSSTPTAFSFNDKNGQGSGTATTASVNNIQLGLISWLSTHPKGVFTQSDVNSARGKALATFKTFIDTMTINNSSKFSCCSSATICPDLLVHAEYATKTLETSGRTWDSSVSLSTGNTICTGQALCLNHGTPVYKPLMNLGSNIIDVMKTPTLCNTWIVICVTP